MGVRGAWHRSDYLTKADENKHVYGFKKLVILRSKLIPLLFLLVLERRRAVTSSPLPIAYEMLKGLFSPVSNKHTHPLRTVALLALLALLSDQVALHLRERLSGPSDEHHEAEVADQLADHCGHTPSAHPLEMK